MKITLSWQSKQSDTLLFIIYDTCNLTDIVAEYFYAAPYCFPGANAELLPADA